MHYAVMLLFLMVFVIAFSRLIISLASLERLWCICLFFLYLNKVTN